VCASPAATIRLPRSSLGRLPRSFVQVLVEITDEPMGLGFHGPVFAPGTKVPLAVFARRPVALECIGAPQRKGRREPITWILWTWDGFEWREVSRAAAVNWEWTLDLRAPARRLLDPEDAIGAAVATSRAVADRLMEIIERALAAQPEAVKTGAWSYLRDQAIMRLVGWGSEKK
jgi:hypothetical protein